MVHGSAPHLPLRTYPTPRTNSTPRMNSASQTNSSPPPVPPRTHPSQSPSSTRAPRKPDKVFTLVAKTKEEEDAYDTVAARHLARPSSVFSSIVQLVKGALGAGILSGHVAYAASGVLSAVILNVLLCIYLTYSLYILVTSAQVLYRRTRIPNMSYADLGQAACSCHPSKKVQKCAKLFRHAIDFIIVLDLFGSCTCYQIMVSQTIKQLVENVQETSHAGKFGYPHLRIYLLAMMLPFVCICLIRHLEWLAKVSLFGNILVLICVFTTVYYSIKENPTFEGMKLYTSVSGTFTCMGMLVFSMSCAGVVLPAENNMKEPWKYPRTLFIAMLIILLCIMAAAFFGYSAYREKSEAPITLNFPMTTFPKILKVIIALNIYCTHGINFWVPYTLLFHYLKRLHAPSKERKIDFLYRAVCSIGITMVGIAFPDVPKVMNFIGCFCLSNIGFMWPSLIQLLVVWERPGLGRMKWRLLRAIVLMVIGMILFVAGSINAVGDIVKLFTEKEDAKITSYNALSHIT